MMYILGIDEVGRGPLAGPVMVGAVCVSGSFDWNKLPGVTDSKVLTEKKREEIYQQAKSLKRLGKIDFVVSSVSAKRIDKIGITVAIKTALNRSLWTLQKRNKLKPSLVQIKLDGGLKAPVEFPHQETIIKGDSKEKIIGLASIVAKVTRDRQMKKLSKLADYMEYGFAVHKGYGTKKHRLAILKYGVSLEHRRCFCKKLLG